MARSTGKRGKDETAATQKKGGGKPDGGARGGIAAPVSPSADLAEIVGKDDLPRSEVISKVWDYIKKHNLQDPKDKRQINADAKLAKILQKVGEHVRDEQAPQCPPDRQKTMTAER